MAARDDIRALIDRNLAENPYSPESSAQDRYGEIRSTTPVEEPSFSQQFARAGVTLPRRVVEMGLMMNPAQKVFEKLGIYDKLREIDPLTQLAEEAVPMTSPAAGRQQELAEMLTMEAAMAPLGMGKGKRMTRGRTKVPKVTKAMKDRVRDEMRQEFADPTTGEQIQEGVRIPDSLIEQRIRDDRLRLSMLSERVEAGIGEKPWRAEIFQGKEPLKGGARYVEGIGMEEGSTLPKPSVIKVGEANRRMMTEAQQASQLKHEGGHGAAHGLERQAPATQAWREAEQGMFEQLHAEKLSRKYGAEPKNLDEFMDYHGELEKAMQAELAGEGGPAAQQAGRELKALHEADLQQTYRPFSATGQLRHSPEEGIADLFQMMIESPEKLTPSVRQLLIDAGFKL